MTYARCPPDVSSFNYFCYAVLEEEDGYPNVTELCASYGGSPLWLANQEEFDWLVNMLDAYSVNCFFLGTCRVLGVTRCTCV